MMKAEQKRLASLAFAAVILLLLVPLTVSSAAAAPGYDDNQYIEFMDDTDAGNTLYEQYKNSLPQFPGGGAPPKHITVQGTKLYINYRLWMDQGVLCYGNYRKVPGNDFKNSTKKPGQPAVKNAGYYSRDGKRGEYRYHGYDVNGNPLTNLNFEPDSVVTKFNERVWIKNPWTELPPNKAPKQSSLYNDAATGSKVYEDPTIKPGVQKWINMSLSQYGGVPLAGGIIDPEVYRYLYVESAPTTLGIGQGRMWHIRPDNSIWYQTIAIPRLEGESQKDSLPVEAKLELLTDITELGNNLKDLGAAMDDKPVILKFRLTGILHDEDVYNDAVKRTVKYNRYDIAHWILTFNDTETQANQADMPQQQAVVPTVENTGTAEFDFKTTYGAWRRHNWNFYITARVQPVYIDKKQGEKDYTAINAAIKKPQKIEDPPVHVVKDFVPKPDIPEIAFEGVPFSASDNTDMSRVGKRRVYVDGVEVSSEEFFSGNYVFPGTVGANGRFVYVDCEYTVSDLPPDALPVITRDVVYIYPTKPIANFRIVSDTWKQNRLIKVQDTSNEGNIRLVIDNFPITEYEWVFGGDTSKLRMGTDTDIFKEFLYKEPGIYSLTLRVKNTLGRWSDPYTVTFQVLEDIAPAVGINLNESVYTRNDRVSAWYYCVESTDGDVIKSSTIELWYDSDNDGTIDQKLKSWSNQEQFPDYIPEKLGYYKFILTAKEDIAGDTLPQHITEADRKSAHYEVEFRVDNYRPLADLYVNIPVQRPNIDLFFMLDKNLDTEKKEFILNNRVNMANWLLGKNIIPNISIWDMHTYTYSQPANTSINTGESYPASSTYYSSKGYSGTLYLTSVSNNSYSRDEGWYEERTESKTATATGSGWGETYWKCGKYGGWVITGSSQSDNPTISYSDADGFSGTLYQVSYTCTSDTGPPSGGKPGDTYTQYRTYSATYSGTVSRKVTVWVPNVVSYNNYTGYYSGTIYKDVRQPYTDSFNATSQKYVVYISDSTVSELNDLNMVMNYAPAAKLFLAGSEDIKAQRHHDLYFSTTGKTIDNAIDEILKAVAENSPSAEKYYVLQNQPFLMNVGQIDLENDAIVEAGMQYVHDPYYFDNPTGVEPGSVSSYSDSDGWTSVIKSSFSNTGKYVVYRRVKDRPSADLRFQEYSYYSGSTSLEIYVVRKPIALAELDWDYDAGAGVYRTTWVDRSYDPDHQYSRADKGIVDRTIKWRKAGGEWNYGIPDHLAPGTYELHYYVLDPEGYWSDPWIYNFNLDPEPSMQFNALLRTLDSRFSLQSVPASELLEAFNLWTRYPYNVRLEMALYNGASRVTQLKTVEFNNSMGTKTGNDITWNNVIYRIPETLPDQTYEFRISAVGDNGKTSTKSFPVNVSTPLELKPEMPQEVTGDTVVQLSARTTKYAGTVTVTLFNGTSYERSYSLTASGTGGVEKRWSCNFTIPGNIPDGNYVAKFTAVAPNGSSQTKYVNFKLINLAIKNVSISGYWNHWRGQQDVFGERLTNEPHRFLSLECVKISVETIGNPELVTVRFSPELEAMTYTDPNGRIYHYGADFFGYEVRFPADSSFIPSGNRVYWEYHLPLAPSTKDWENNRLRQPYRMTVTAYKAGRTVEYVIDDIEITGNIYDLTYIQPKN